MISLLRCGMICVTARSRGRWPPGQYLHAVNNAVVLCWVLYGVSSSCKCTSKEQCCHNARLPFLDGAASRMQVTRIGSQDCWPWSTTKVRLHIAAPPGRGDHEQWSRHKEKYDGLPGLLPGIHHCLLHHGSGGPGPVKAGRAS